MATIPLKDKIEKVSKLNQNETTKLMRTLLEKKGFTNICSNEDCISATQSGLLGDTSIVFITFAFKLSGNLETKTEDIADNIRQIRNKYSANAIFIYSQMVISKGFQDSLNSLFSSAVPNYIGRDEMVTLIDEVLPDFWRHEDLTLIKYEKEMISYLNQDNDLRKLKFPKENYSKLMDIFIEPHMVRYYEDPKTKITVQKKYSMEELISHKDSLIIDGPAGYGKSTLLKSIAKSLIEQNTVSSEKRNFPIYLTSFDIFEGEYNIGNAIRAKIASITDSSINELSKNYYIHLLIDSIDEFDDRIQSITNELAELSRKYRIKYYIATRNTETIASKSTAKLSTFSIKRFNLGQIKLFLNAFFSGDEGKSSTLLDAIRDNQMLERLPMSPLTLSLITILFEEKELEIPATISDIYDNFNTLIIGKSIVSSKIEFIDISFKERILCIYAYKLLQTQNHIPLSKSEFINYFHNYYEGKSLPIKKGSLEDVLLYLIQNTGILYLNDGDRVQFTHDSYMEYYSALEIFKHQRHDEIKLVNNFFDPHWQNTAVFYAGMSKDMPQFLNKIKEKISKGSNIYDFMSAILGAGFMLQALYQTDNKLRKEVVLEALRISLENLRVFKMMAADDMQLFKNYNLPILTFINFVYFYESFNSITLSEPLSLAFEDKYEEYSISKNPGIGYNLMELAFTLDSRRIKNQKPLEKMINTPEILKDPLLNILASISMDILGKEHYKEYLNELKKTKASLSAVQRDLVKLPMSKLRFSAADNINQPSNVTLFVEGITDATILEYAYMVLTNGSMPYWNITAAGIRSNKNSCAEVAKTLKQSYAHWKVNMDSVFIGIFDHDSAGLSSFRGLLEEKTFDEIEKDVVKKHKEANIYGICLPVPGELDKYLQKKQEFNFFEIEHYFGESYLRDNNMLVESGIDGIFEINDSTGAKTSFAKKMKETSDPKVFEHFLLLFKQIDKLARVSIDYVI